VANWQQSINTVELLQHGALQWIAEISASDEMSKLYQFLANIGEGHAVVYQA
jgi:hypothetical protein